MTDPTFLVVDVEALGFSPPAALIELGWCSVRPWRQGPPPLMGIGWDDREQYVIGELIGQELYGLAGQTMTPDNRAVHHIDPADLAGLEPFDRQRMLGLADGFAIQGVTHAVAHSVSMEEQWLDFGVPWICTYKCALHAWPDAPSHSNQALKYYLGCVDRDMFYPPHRALPDALVTAYMLTRLLDEHPVEQLLEWTRQPKPVLKLPFGKHKGMLIAEAPGDYLDWVAGPRCEAADPDLKFACTTELERRRTARSPFSSLTPGDRTDD